MPDNVQPVKGEEQEVSSSGLLLSVEPLPGTTNYKLSADGTDAKVPGVEGLARILEPCAPEEFLGSSWGVRLSHVRGRAGKFARLMPWERLNEILRRHRLDFPRLRLVRDGSPAPVSSYLRHVAGGHGRMSIPR